MAEPIPSVANEGADDSKAVPANAEDRRAAAALNALDSNAIDSDAAQQGAKQIDQDALGKAMNRLEIAAGTTKNDTTAEKKATRGEEKKRREEEEAKRKKAVKVKAEDVTFLVEELDLTKPKATDLLKTYEGDPAKAIKAFITPKAVKA